MASTLKRALRSGEIVQGMIGGVVGCVVMVGFFELRHTPALAPIAAAFTAMDARDLLVLPLLWLLAVAAHELGHLFAGLARGMRFAMIVIGPFGLVRAGERLQLRSWWHRNVLGGYALAMPDESRPLLPQLWTLVAGGPLASLALAFAAGAGVYLLPGRFAGWSLAVALVSLLLFVATAVPARTAGIASDGLQLRELRRDPAFLRRRANLFALLGATFAGTRPARQDPDLLARLHAATGAEPAYDLAAWQFAYQNAVDRGDIDAAGEWLARIEPLLDDNPGFREGHALEFALFEAWYRQRPDVAATWLAKARAGIVDPSRRALATAALAARRGEHALAHRQLDIALHALGKGMDRGLALLTGDQIAAIRASLPAPA